MDTQISLGNPPITVAVRQSARARRLSLRVSGIDGRVSLTVPPSVGGAEARRFLQERETWLRKHIARAEGAVPVGPGAQLLIEGRPRIVSLGPVVRISLEEDRLILPERLPHPARGIVPWIKRQVRPVLQEACHGYAQQLGRDFAKVSLKDTRSRWGSCSTAGNLNFSWRLYLAPPEVLRYVAAHEVAHLVEMNHSPAFWAVVESIAPGWQQQRSWLRAHGTQLHRYEFEGS